MVGPFRRKQSKSDGGAPTGLVTVSRADPIATIRINNAPHKNVFTTNLTNDLIAAFESISAEDDVRCVVLAAEGVDFSAGPDLAEMASFDRASAQKYWRLGRRLTDAIEDARQPVVCAIRGSCVSVGLSVALACDIRLAASDAVMAFPDAQYLQLPPGWGATQRLVHMIGSQRAKYLLITGARLNAEEAADENIVHDVVPTAELDGRARELAGRIAASPLFVLEQIKYAVDGGVDVEYGTAIRLEEQAWLRSWDVPGRSDIIKDADHRLNAQ